MDNQHRKIKGYNELTQEQIDLMNKIKQHGANLELLCAEVQTSLFDTAPDHEPTTPDGVVAADQFRSAYGFYLSGLHDLQVGLMKLTRSVARPGFF